MNEQQFEYLSRIAKTAAVYIAEQLDEMVHSGSDFVSIRNRRQRNNDIKKQAKAYVTSSDFALSKFAQAAPPPAPFPPEQMPGIPAQDTPPGATAPPLPGGDTPSATPNQFQMPQFLGGGDVADPTDNNESLPPDIQQYLNGKVVELLNLVQDVSRNVYKMNLSQPDQMRVVKESLKTISNKVADVPIQGVIDNIDSYLQRTDKAKSKQIDNEPTPNQLKKQSEQYQIIKEANIIDDELVPLMKETIVSQFKWIPLDQISDEDCRYAIINALAFFNVHAKDRGRNFDLKHNKDAIIYTAIDNIESELDYRKKHQEDQKTKQRIQSFLDKRLSQPQSPDSSILEEGEELYNDNPQNNKNQTPW